jgi:putative sigma-54 modulation protein
MNINIKSTNITLTPAIKDYAEKKILSLEKFIHDKPENVRVEIEVGKTSNHHKSGDIFRSEAHISFKGQEFYVLSEKDDLYASIDEMKAKAEREITTIKDKKLTLIKRGAAQIKKILRRSK